VEVPDGSLILGYAYVVLANYLKLKKCGGIVQECPIGVVMLRLTELRDGEAYYSAFVLIK
jgi:hypothetical protein